MSKIEKTATEEEEVEAQPTEEQAAVEEPLNYPMTVPDKPKRFGHGLVSDEEYEKEVESLKHGRSKLKPAKGTKLMDAALEEAEEAAAEEAAKNGGDA